jgi:erythromycin esterase
MNGTVSAAAVRPLHTLDPAAPLDDLQWLDEAVGDARVVAIGESAHYNRESFQLRHRLLRHLVERHGFGAYAMETGFVEGWRADGWVRGGDEPLGAVMADGMTSLMGMWTPMRAHLEWMRGHNRAGGRPVGFYGIDLPGSIASLLPGVDAALAYLAQADPEHPADPSVRDTAAALAATSAFSAPAAFSTYASLPPGSRDALTAGLADLAAHTAAHRRALVRRTSADAYERALRSLTLTVTLDAMFRRMAAGHQHAVLEHREAAIADTVEWILGREERIVLAAHNAHVQRRPHAMPGMPAMTPAGMHLADRLGAGYLVIGTTTGTGQTLNTTPDFYSGTLFAPQEAPEPGSLDALMAAGHDQAFATDLRRLSPADDAAVRAATRQRYGTYYAEQAPLDAFDVIVHLPHVTAAEPDRAALEHAPREVRDTFSRWAG